MRNRHLFPGPGKPRGRGRNHLLRDAKGQAEITGPPKTPPRHRQDIFLLEAGHAVQVISTGGLGKEIKGALGA